MHSYVQANLWKMKQESNTHTCLVDKDVICEWKMIPNDKVLLKPSKELHDVKNNVWLLHYSSFLKCTPRPLKLLGLDLGYDISITISMIELHQRKSEL